MTVDVAGGTVLPERRFNVVLTTLHSDAHTWNLVYLQLLLEELGWRVTNLGACPPDDVVVKECVERHPDLVVVSSLNGHGIQDGVRLINALRARPELGDTPVVIGGRLDVTGGADGRTSERLLAAGFDAVFENVAEINQFRSFVATLSDRTTTAIGPR